MSRCVECERITAVENGSTCHTCWLHFHEEETDLTERLDKIDERLAEFCTAGYSLGLIGEANIAYVVDNFPELVTVQRVYRLGDQAQLRKGVDDDTPGLAELEEFLSENWEDYPVFDESYLSEIQAKLEDEWVLDFANTHKVAGSKVWEAINELEGYFEWEQDYVYYSCDEEELLAKAEELGQTWQAHYYSGESHTPEVCKYCKEAEVA